jgi:hypothetical protein
MFHRMEKQFEIAKVKHKPVRAIIQLAAVLGLIYQLRCEVEKAVWVPRGLFLLPPLFELRKFFLAACHYLYSPSQGLLHAAITELGGEEYQELTYIRGYLTWLAWECKFDARLTKLSNERNEKLEQVRALDRLLQIIPDLGKDESALAIARQVSHKDHRFLGYEAWLEQQLSWYEGIATNWKSRLKLMEPSEEISIGDIVYRKQNKLHLTMVLEVNGSKAKLAENEKISYGVDHLIVVRKASQPQKSNLTTNDWRRLLGGSL